MENKTNIPEHLTPVDNSLLAGVNLNLDVLNNNSKIEWNIPNPVTSIIEPPSMQEKFKPVTDRIDETNEILEKQIELYEVENQKLRTQLEQVNSQLKEESDRLKEETAKREEAESKLTLKDWKVALIALGSALLVLAIEHYKDIYDFIISLSRSPK